MVIGLFNDTYKINNSDDYKKLRRFNLNLDNLESRNRSKLFQLNSTLKITWKY